jgi:hypothetical protein
MAQKAACVYALAAFFVAMLNRLRQFFGDVPSSHSNFGIV